MSPSKGRSTRRRVRRRRLQWVVVPSLLLCGSLLGCSMIDPASRPVADAPGNLSCALEYRPVPPAGLTDAEGTLGPDLRFTASAHPYDQSKFLHSPIDVLFHLVFAPGKHLDGPLEVEGATCDRGGWRSGKRLRRRDALLCRRIDLAEVRIRARTKHGFCEVLIPEGDATPRCSVRTSDYEFARKRERELLRDFGRPCASPEPGVVLNPEPPW